MSDFIPADDAGRVKWITDFARELPPRAVQLGVTNAELASVQQDAAYYSYLVNGAVVGAQRYLNDLKSLQKIIDEGPASSALGVFPTLNVLPEVPKSVAPGLWKRIRKLVQRIKSHPGYTEAAGQSLSLIAPTVTTDNSAAIKKLVALPNHQVQLVFAKGKFSGVQIETRRGSETEWTALDKALASPYLDARAPQVAGQPENREYRIRYLKGNEPIGEWSATKSISTRA